MNKDLSILVMSCDKFSPVWDIFYSLFEKNWPEFKGRMYHYSETKSQDREGVTSITSGFAKTAGLWSDGLLHSLEQINTQYVIMMLEDFFLNRKVDDAAVNEIFDYMRSNQKIKCIRLVPIPPARSADWKNIGRVPKGSAYRNSTQIAIWDKEYLKSVTIKGESAWDFEHKGSIRSTDLEGEVWAAIAQPHESRVMTHINGIIRGKMTKEAQRFLKSKNIRFDPAIPVHNTLENYYWNSAPTLVRKGMDFINKNIFPFLWKDKL